MKPRKNDNYFFIYLFEFCVERPFYPFFRQHNSGFDGFGLLGARWQESKQFGCAAEKIKKIWGRLEITIQKINDQGCFVKVRRNLSLIKALDCLTVDFVYSNSKC